MELTDLEKIRMEKLQNLVARGVEPYPTRANPTHTIQEALTLLDAAEKAGGELPKGITLTGRLRAMRPMGKLTFAQVEDGTGKIQFFFRINEVGEEVLASLTNDYDLGDFIEGTGNVMRTRTGEPTLQILSFRMLAKSISPLPAAKDEVVDGKIIHHAGLTDPETRYRQRYADLVVNPEVRKVFTSRAAIVRALRDFLDNRGF
ncbi:MAG: OB-fold nucleic acid binding domain-containing protein, partial [Anaerolineaceae bacterium]